jgi:hypothetical protein
MRVDDYSANDSEASASTRVPRSLERLFHRLANVAVVRVLGVDQAFRIRCPPVVADVPAPFGRDDAAWLAGAPRTSSGVTYRPVQKTRRRCGFASSREGETGDLFRSRITRPGLSGLAPTYLRVISPGGAANEGEPRHLSHGMRA